MIARRTLVTFALATLFCVGCTPTPTTTPAPKSSVYTALTQGPPTALLAHLENLDRRYAAADHRDLDVFRADLLAYSDATVATADALIESKDAPAGLRRQAAGAKFDALVRRIEAEPKALDKFLEATDRLEKEPADSGLPALASYRRVKGMIDAFPLDEIDDATLDRLIPAADHLGMLDPPNPEAAPLLLDIAKAAERHRKTEGAKGLYTLLASRFADQPAGKFAPGCVARLENLSRPLDHFSGPSLTDDATIDLADYRGKVVLIDFWASWCAPCLAEMYELKAYRERLAPKGFEILGACLDEEPSKPREGVKKHGLNWPHLRAVADAKKEGEAAEENLATRFGIELIPFKMVIDRDGRFIASGSRLAEVEDAIQAALATPATVGK